MQLWSSASASSTPERDALVRRFVEASRRAGIVALVNAARTEHDVACAVAQELCEAFDAEIAFVIVTRPEQGRRETIGHVGLTEAQAAAVSADHLCRAAWRSRSAASHARSSAWPTLDVTASRRASSDGSNASGYSRATPITT